MIAKHSTTSPFILILIVALGVLVGYIFYSQTSSDIAVEIPILASANDPEYLKFKDLKYDFSLMDDQTFNTLKTYGEFPIQPGQTGKTDIFNAF